MIAGLIRPLWEWALWSRRRATLTLCALLTVTVALARITHAASGHAPGYPPAPARHSAAAATARTPAAPGEGTSGSGLAGAFLAGEQFAAAWVSHAPGWEQQARKYATPALSARLGAAARSRWHTAAVTGPAATAGEAGGAITLTVPTTSGVALITVVRAAGGWLVSAARFATAGR